MDSFAGRRYIIILLFFIMGFIYLVRLFTLQVVDSSYKLSASNNVLRYVTQYPARGLIYDRNGKLMVYNEAAYDIMVNPRQLEPFDTTEFCNLLDIEVDFARTRLQEAFDYSSYKPSIFLKQVSSERYAMLQEKLYQFPGFFVQPRTLRKYASPVAPHLLGYVGEVGEKTIEDNSYYKSGDYIGISGMEKSYEEVLRGEKGVNVYLVDVHNRIKGPFEGGRYDKQAQMGANIISSIDADLQAYGEKLMANKIGSIVAIEPSSGEILSLVSTPGYDPGLLIGRKRTRNYRRLQHDTLKPLFNRALMAQYPPGSTFKLINALIGLEEGVVRPPTQYHCNYGYYSSGHHVGCHGHKSPVDLVESIQVSCNAYYCNVFRNILDNPKYEDIYESFDKWRAYLLDFGFGQKSGVDLTNELKGIIPSTEFYDRYYRRNGWKSITVVSLAIGQGELGTTPIQMANMTAAIANRGHYYPPHVVKEIEGDMSLDSTYKIPRKIPIDSAHFETVIEGMDLAVNGEPGSGSTARSAHMGGITICGKTGTAENPHGEDHSIFVAFAPKEDPQIAIAVYVENGGFGSKWAAPTARLMIEKYLTDSISQPWWEQYVLNGDLLNVQDEETD